KILPQLKRISSVSGGSITAGMLAIKWNDLQFSDGVATAFGKEVVDPIRKFAGTTIDVPAVLKGVFGLFSVGNRVAGYYRKHLFGDKTLQDLPDQPAPLFVFNATNLQSGVLWRFTKPFMWDYRVGKVPNPKMDIATAV